MSQQSEQSDRPDSVEKNKLSRRDALALTGAGGAAALAGCVGGLPIDQDGGGIKTGQNAYEGQKMTALLKNGYEEAIMLDYQKNFEKRTGVDVNFEQYSESKTRQKFILAANNQSKAYNVGVVQFWYYPEYHKNDWMQPINGYLENKQADWINFEWDAIYDSVKKPFTTDGTHYGVPHTLITGMLWYRKSVFDKLGLDEPKTVKDVKQAAKTIHESDEVDMSGIIGRAAPKFAAFNTWAGWAWAYGAKVLGENKKVTIDTPEFREAMTDLVTMFRDYGPDGLASANFPQLQPYMVEGDAAMHWGTSAWGSIYTNTKVGDDIKATLIKGPADNWAQWFYGESLMIPKWIPTKMKGPAWQFLQWRQSKKVALKELEMENRYDNPNKMVLQSDQYDKAVKEAGLKDWSRTLFDSFEKMNDEYWPYVPEFVDIGNAFMQEFSSAVAGDQSADKAVTKSQKRVHSIMEDAGYYD